jgi:holo-[acyl-carrier protein] synthase
VIRGIGIDLVSIARVAGVWERHGERFARRILSASEWPELAATRHPERLLAKRFAVKEAFAKALGTGVRPPMSFQLVSVLHGALGEPVLATHGALSDHLAARGIDQLHLSLSDERDATVAMVVLESLP